MARSKSGFVQPQQIDEWMSQTTPAEVAAFYGADWPSQAQSGEARIACVFSDECRESAYGNLTVQMDHPQNLIYCHGCSIRGNLMTLMFGMKHGRPIDGEKLRGGQFKEILADLRSIRGEIVETVAKPAAVTVSPSSARPAAKPVPSKPAEPEFNVPLKDSPNERARGLVTMDQSFVTDPAVMNEKAARYARSREWLTPEVMQQWRVGYLPRSAKSLYRGYFMYPLLDEAGDVLTWFGRDLNFEEKYLKWDQEGRDPDKRPSKTRFVSGFKRGLELFGQHGRDRLKDNPLLRESLATTGLMVVEGPNDVIRLDTLGAAAVGLMSNQATSEQIVKLIRFAKETAAGRIVLLPDNDADGERGFKDLLWKLQGVEGIDVQLGWSRWMFDGKFAGRQPESLSSEEWKEVLPTLRRRS